MIDFIIKLSNFKGNGTIIIVVLLSIIWFFIKKEFNSFRKAMKKVDEIGDNVNVVDAKLEGQLSFSSTILRHDTELAVINEKIENIEEDIKTILEKLK